MFTGLIQQIGVVRSSRRMASDEELEVTATFPELVLGESIAVDGVCLTVSRLLSDGFAAIASFETLATTTLGKLKAGRQVHLERALKLGESMGGHIVSGHVDGVGKIIAALPVGEAVKNNF